jgi:hypothetical protein
MNHWTSAGDDGHSAVFPRGWFSRKSIRITIALLLFQFTDLKKQAPVPNPFTSKRPPSDPTVFRSALASLFVEYVYLYVNYKNKVALFLHFLDKMWYRGVFSLNSTKIQPELHAEDLRGSSIRLKLNAAK